MVKLPMPMGFSPKHITKYYCPVTERLILNFEMVPNNNIESQYKIKDGSSSPEAVSGSTSARGAD